MKKKSIIILAVFMILSFVGLLGVQLVYSMQLLSVRESNFDDAVKRSLYRVSNDLEEEVEGCDVDIYDIRRDIESEFRNNMIITPFHLEVINQEGNVFSTDTIIATRDSVPVESFYSQVVLLGDKQPQMHFLRVWFPEKQLFIIKSVIPTTIFSVVSTLLLFAVFVAAIALMAKQRKLSNSKTEFMHNMTHELKTPISSIMLASEMLADDSVAKSDKMREHLTKVIKEETKRLSFQVEKVLQISLLDNEKSILKFKSMDVHAIIESVVNNFEIKVSKSGGSIETNLNAVEHVTQVDELHFTNVIYNLLDNAVKYCKPDVPLMLKISTEDNPNRKNTLSIIIEDNGIGISKEYQEKIFEKFLRVPTGNLHNVKGFGLGLAYVRKMVNAHGGDIICESTPTIGTKFKINIPIKL